MFVFLFYSPVVIAIVMAITVYVIMRYQKKHSTSSAAAANYPNNAATNLNFDAGIKIIKFPLMMRSTDGK